MSYKFDSYKRLGDYIQEVDIRNRDLQCTKLLGLSIAKTFIPSIANTVGTDFRPYKIVKHNQFAYVPVTSRNGDKITVALYDGEEDCIISQAYISFEIKDTSKLLPEYLMMWFRRPEFDRYARFKSHGSAREVFDWEEMCNVLMPIPDIKEQQRIVDQYNAIQNRIETNKQTIVKLEETAQAIYRKMFIDNIDPEDLPKDWKKGTLSELANISSGTTCSAKSSYPDIRYKYPVAGAAGIIGYSSEYNKDKKILTTGRVGTLGVTCRYNEKVWYADNVLVIEPQRYEYVHQILNQLDFNILIKFGVQSLITQSGLKEYPIVIPPENLLDDFEKVCSNIFAHIELLKTENEKLGELIHCLQNNL